MAFPTPNFNLSVNLWRGATIASGPVPLPAPDLTFLANLSYAKGRNQITSDVIVSPGRLAPLVGVELLCPARTDIRGHVLNAFNGDLVEVPAGTGRLYLVIFVEDVGRGFSNEYRIAVMNQVTSEMITLSGYALGGTYLWPQPTP